MINSLSTVSQALQRAASSSFVLIADYTRDIIYPAAATPIIVEVPASVDSLSVDAIPYLRKALKIHNKDGGRPRISVLLLNNPHNPLARAYPTQTLLEYAKLAEEVLFLCCVLNLAHPTKPYQQFDLHLVADEVFANQVFSSAYCSEPTPFTSILSLDLSGICDPSRVYVLAGPTKDFGASGVKVGAFISQKNPGVLKLVKASLDATPISSASDTLFTAILDDEPFCDEFLKDNRLRLALAFELIASWCSFHKLP